MKKTIICAALSALSFVSAGMFAPAAVAQDGKGNVKDGERKASMCIGCHGIVGYQASFPEVHKVPMIAGQSAEYIAAALAAYKKGDRKHPSMRGIAGSLSDQDMLDLAAFYAQQGQGSNPVASKAAAAPSPKVAELLNRAACMSCHGDNFNKPISPAYPKLAGQHADYLYVALKAYQVNNSPLVGRANAMMSPMSGQYSNKELKLIANYLASLPGDLRVVPEPSFRQVK